MSKVVAVVGTIGTDWNEVFTVPEFVKTIPFGTGNPEPRDYEAEAKVWREFNGKGRWVTRISDGKVQSRPRHISEEAAATFNELVMESWLDSDSDAPMPADMLACAKDERGEYLCDCDDIITVAYERDGMLFQADVPNPELTADFGDPAPYFETTLSPYGKGGALVNDATSVVTHVEKGMRPDPMRTEEEATQAWIDGVAFNTEIVPGWDASILAEFLPVFYLTNSAKVFRTVGNTIARCEAKDKDGKYGICEGAISYREVSLQSRSDAENKAAFVAALFEHQAEFHPLLTSEDFCEHGQRNHVTGTNAKDQRWEGLLCKRGRSKTACAPIWVND